MTNFETMIRDALASGQSFEDIAKNFSNVLNKVEKEESPAVKRKARVDEIRRIFNKSLENDSLNISDVAALAVLVTEGNHPDWDVETINAFFDMVRDNVTSMEKVISADPMKMLTNLLGLAEEKLQTPTRGKDMRTAESGIKSRSDADRVQAFLSKL